MTIFLVLLGFTVLRVLVIGVGASLLIHPVRQCPACWRETIPVRQILVDLLPRSYELRWCPHCHWKGLARRRIPAR